MGGRQLEITSDWSLFMAGGLEEKVKIFYEQRVG